MVGPQDFRARKQAKEHLSHNPNTIRSHQYEVSLAGLDAGLNKVQRNLRTARSRALKSLKESPLWSTWTAEGCESEEALVVRDLEAKYEQQKVELRRKWEVTK